MNQMVKQNLIEYLKDSEGRIILPTYLGRPIFMDDGLTYGKGQYLSLIFGARLLGMAKVRHQHRLNYSACRMAAMVQVRRCYGSVKHTSFIQPVTLGLAVKASMNPQLTPTTLILQIGFAYLTVN